MNVEHVCAVARENAAVTDSEARWPEKSIRAVSEAGLLGLTIPREMGGPGGSMREFVRVTEELASACGSTAMIYLMHVCGAQVIAAAGHKAAVTALSWRPDSKLVASASEDGTVKLWELQEGKQVKSWTAHKAGVLGVAYGRDGRLVSCGRDNEITLWNANGSKKRSFESSLPLRVTFSEDAKRIVAADFAGKVMAWDADDGKRVGELDANPLPLADQLAAARQRLRELDSRTNTQAMAELGEAKAAVQRIEAAQLRTTLYQARESLAAKKREQDQLAATLASNAQALRQAQKELAAARDATAKADAQISAARAATLRAETAAKHLSAQIAVEQAGVDHLLEQYRAATAGPEKLAQRLAQ